ncbi:MAG TPA: cupredoxin domain-containing protein [Acidimicrobiales bacterium]|nr:cupredoxin domain-containing protein [Acidimicrobiales bacterium]
MGNALCVLFRRLLVLALIPFAFGACGDSSSPATHVAVSLSDAGCSPPAVTVKAGKIAFDVTNRASTKVTSFAVEQQSQTIASLDHVASGKKKTLTVTLKQGAYNLHCRNGSDVVLASLTVTPPSGGTTTSCVGPGIGGYGAASGNNGGAGTNDNAGNASDAGSVDGTSSGCSTPTTASVSSGGTIGPTSANNGGGAQPGGTPTPNVTTNP